MELNDYDNHIELSNSLKKSHDVKKIMPEAQLQILCILYHSLK